MAPLNSNRDRLAAMHHHFREPASPLLGLRRRLGLSPQVVADTHRAVPGRAQPTAATMQALARGSVSLSVALAPSGFGPTARRSSRSVPRPRTLSQRDRREAPAFELPLPAFHPAIGKSVISPIIVLGGSDL